MRVATKRCAVLTAALALAVGWSSGQRIAQAAEGAKHKQPAAESKGKSELPPKPLIRDDLLLLPEADPDMGSPPLKVNFKGEIYDEDVARPQFTWNFGDGTPDSHERNPSHTYKAPGVYKVRLAVIDYWKRKGSEELTIVVDAPPED